jgi:hypothetical protein
VLRYTQNVDTPALSVKMNVARDWMTSAGMERCAFAFVFVFVFVFVFEGCGGLGRGMES